MQRAFFNLLMTALVAAGVPTLAAAQQAQTPETLEIQVEEAVSAEPELGEAIEAEASPNASTDTDAAPIDAAETETGATEAAETAVPTEANEADAAATDEPLPPLRSEDAAYLLYATSASNAQMKLAELAVEKASDEAVRQYAQDVLDHYSARYDMLSALARKYGATPATELDPVSEHRMTELGKLEGPAFDAYYVFGQVPELYTESWIHRRVNMHGTVPEVIAAGEGEFDRINELHDRARDLATEREGDLPEGLRPGESAFLVFNMNVDKSQVVLGEAAAGKAAGPSARAFAERMATEHGGSYEAAAAMAEQKGLERLENPGPTEVLLLESVAGLEGPAFDIAYMEAQIIHHGNWYKRFEHARIHSLDPDVRALAIGGDKVGKLHHNDGFGIIKRY